MSVYSGFVSKNLETNYFFTLGKLLNLCQSTLTSFLRNENIDFLLLSESFPKLFKNLKDLENQKSSEPKFSVFCSDLAKYFDCLKPQAKPLPSKIEESKSSKNFDVFLMNDIINVETLKSGSQVINPKIAGNRSFSSQKPRISSRKLNVSIPGRARPLSSKSRGTVNSNSSRKSFFAPKKEKVVPSKYYHQKALEMISESIDNSG
jgi:hypothetical protein